MTIFLFIFTLFSPAASALSVGADLRSFDSFFLDGVRIDSEIGFEYQNLRIIIPVRYGKSKDYDISLIETGLLVAVRPWEELGFFAEASLFKLGWTWGLYAPDERKYLSAEGSIGWEYRFHGFYIRPKYTVRSFLSADDRTLGRIVSIPQFGESRISLHMGIIFGGNYEKNESD